MFCPSPSSTKVRPPLQYSPHPQLVAVPFNQDNHPYHGLWHCSLMPATLDVSWYVLIMDEKIRYCIDLIIDYFYFGVWVFGD